MAWGLAGCKEFTVPLKYIEYGVYGDLTRINPKPCSIYLRGTINNLPYYSSVVKNRDS